MLMSTWYNYTIMVSSVVEIHDGIIKLRASGLRDATSVERHDNSPLLRGL